MARTIYAKDPVKFIPALAGALKEMKEFEIPEWAKVVKSGVSRERPPVDDDFWYTRAASILRQLYIKGVVGVGRLRSRYGSRKDRGGRAGKFFKAGGKIIRVILQQAEAAGLVEKVSRMQHGRRLSAKGRELLDSIEVEKKTELDFEKMTIEPVEITKQNTDEDLNGHDSSKDDPVGPSGEPEIIDSPKDNFTKDKNLDAENSDESGVKDGK